MSDLIDRDSVINAIVAWTVEDRPDVEMPTDLIDRIKALPTAQPERCLDCINLNKTQMLIPQPEPHWIPCSERLPEKAYGQYWVCTDTEYQCQCRWTDDVYGLGSSGEWAWKIFDIPQYSHVVAWMPLPSPYKGEQE